MIVLKVDPAKLPRAEDLKALMFPSTIAVVSDDTSIRLVSRESFPNIVGGLSAGPIGMALLAPALQAARARALAASAGPPGQAPAAPGAITPPTTPSPPVTGGPGGPGGPRGPRGGRPGGGRGPG